MRVGFFSPPGKSLVCVALRGAAARELEVAQVHDSTVVEGDGVPTVGGEAIRG